MKKLSTIFAVLFAALICVTSCGSSSDDGNDPAPTPSNVILSAKDFVNTEWKGSDKNSKEVTLKVSSSTNMTLNYYTKTLAKGTEEFTLQSVTIAYTFDETKGSFTGKDGDTQYSGTLTDSKTMTFKMPSEEVTLKR